MDSPAKQEDQLKSTQEKTNESLVSAENASPSQENLETSKCNPTESPLPTTDTPAASTVSVTKYNELLQKYKMIYEACKVYTERKKSLKCTWTQCPKQTMQARGANTEPTMMQLIAESPQVSQLQVS